MASEEKGPPNPAGCLDRLPRGGHFVTAARSHSMSVYRYPVKQKVACSGPGGGAEETGSSSSAN